MIISQSGIVDIIPEFNRQLRPIFCVSEGDKNTRMINITVQQGGENFTIPTSASVYITGRKADNTIFTNQCSYSGYIVSFQIAAQMSAANGIVLCELQIIDGGNPLGSANFVYWVEPSPIDGGTASESDLNVFLEAILGAERLDHFYANIEGMVTEAVSNIQIHEGQTVIDASLSVSGAAADAKATGDHLRAFYGALMTETSSGTVAEIDDGAEGVPVKQITAHIEPMQSGSGDPSPDNVRPITGYESVTVSRTGKNMLPITGRTSTSGGITYTYNDDGTVTATGTATGSTTNNYGHVFLPKGTYAASGCTGGSTSTYRIRLGKGSWTGTVVTQNYNGDSEFTLEEETEVFVRIYVGVAAGENVNFTFYPMIRPVSYSDTTYETYGGAEYPITLPSAVGTFYGGTLTVYDDGSGTLTVTKNSLATFDGSENWTVATGTHPSYRVARGSIPANASGLVCNMLIMDDQQTAVDGHGYVGTTNVVCYLDTASADNLDAWKASLATTPMQIVYMTGDPITYALTAPEVTTLLGNNNIWMNASGTIDVTYRANTGLYVNKTNKATRSMIAGVEAEMVATKNYAVGDLLIVGNTLYKVTAAIASGAEIVEGTNVTATTVAEQLLLLA